MRCHTRFATATLPLLLLALAGAACDSTTDPPLHVVSITLDAVGDYAQLTAVNAGDRLPKWESLHPDIVTVTEAGLVVAVAEGTATVRARVGSRVDDGTVVVRPPVEIELYEASIVTEPSGEERLRVRLRNLGGRGFYRLQYWRDAETPGGEDTLVLQYLQDFEAPVGLDIFSSTFLQPDSVDRIVAFSREPLSQQYVRTGCVRIDGEACNLP